jgi:hypothetical protein
MVIGLCLNEITAIGSAITTGQNIAYKAMGWSTLAIIASGGLRVLGLNTEWGVVGLSIATVVGMVINNVVQWGVALRHVPWLGVAWPLRGELCGSLLIGSKNVVAAGLKMLILSGDLLLVGWALGAEASGTYAAAGILVRILLEPVGGIVIPAFGPSLKVMTGSGRRTETNLLRIEIISFSLSLMGLLGGVVILVGPTIGEKWLKEIVNIPLVLTVWLVWAELLKKVFLVNWEMLESLLEFRQRSVAMFVWSVVTAVAAVLLMQREHLWVAAAFTTLAFVLIWIHNELTLYRLGLRWRSRELGTLVRSLVGSLLVTALSIAGGAYVRQLAERSLISALGVSIFGLLILMVITWLISLGQGSRNRLIQVATRSIRQFLGDRG